MRGLSYTDEYVRFDFLIGAIEGGTSMPLTPFPAKQLFSGLRYCGLGGTGFRRWSELRIWAISHVDCMHTDGTVGRTVRSLVVRYTSQISL